MTDDPMVLGYARCPHDGCITEIPLDGRAACYYHTEGSVRVPLMAQDIAVRPCVCGGTIDARREPVIDAVRRHNDTAEHVRYFLGLPAFSSRRRAA